MAGTGSPLDDRWRQLTPKTQPTASGADQSTRKRSLGITELMTIVDPTQPPSGGHPTPEVRQAPEGGTSDTFSKIPHDMFGRVSPNAIAVAAALAKCAKNKTGECFPSAQHLADLLGSEEKPAPHPNTVRRGIKELKAAGFIEVTHRRRLDNNGNGIPGPPSTSNLYRLLWIAPRGNTAKSPPSVAS